MLGVQQRLRQPVVTRSFVPRSIPRVCPNGQAGQCFGERGTRSATHRLRGLHRPLPLPWANSTVPRGASGIARSACRRSCTQREQLGGVEYCSVVEYNWSTAPHRRSNPPRTPPRRRSDRASSCGNVAGVAWLGHVSLKINVESVVDSTRATIESTRPPNRTTHPDTESDKRRSEVVPPAGFEPALPPPETGRTRDRRRLLASYLGFVFASCVSGGLPRAVVRSTRHSTPSVLIGRVRDPRARRSRRSPDVERREREFADEAAGGDPGVVGRPWAAAELGVGLDLAPAGGHAMAVGEERRAQRGRSASCPGCAGPNGGRGSTWSARRR